MKLKLLQCRKCLRLIGISQDDGMVADLIMGGRNYKRGYYKHYHRHVKDYTKDIIHWQSRNVWLS